MLNFTQPTPEPVTRISVIEQNNAIRESLVAIIDSSYGFQAISAYKTWNGLAENFAREKPHVIIASIAENNETLQLNLEKEIKKFKKLFPATRILVFSIFEEDKDVFPIIRAGADGYLTRKTSYADLLEAIQEVYSGGAPLSLHIAKKVVTSFHMTANPYLSRREEEVLRHLAIGKTSTQIAKDLFLSGETIKTHMKNIYIKLNVRNKSEAIQKGLNQTTFSLLF